MKFIRFNYKKCFAVLLCIFTILNIDSTWSDDSIEVERLTWAGIKLVQGDTTVLVDAVGIDLWDGNAPEGLVAVTADTRRRYALVSHTHNDHFDVDTLKQVLGEKGYVICAESVAAHIASRGLKVISAPLYHPIARGGFVFTAIPAQDGLGSDQVSWVISTKEQRFLHAGDTLWHGQWKLIGDQFGPFDATFLPINGARLESDIPAVMTPIQAVNAAVLLRSKLLVPIHYGLNDPPYYVEVTDPIATLKKEAKKRNVVVRHLKPGEKL
jgi:L-ascorbate metabolism protein UlaG (beta-lactamase superfamily)